MNSLFVSSIYEVSTLQCIIPSCNSKGQFADKFNDARVNLDGISKI